MATKPVYSPKNFVALEPVQKFNDLILDTPYKLKLERDAASLTFMGVPRLARFLRQARPDRYYYWDSSDWVHLVRAVGTEWLSTSTSTLGGKGTYPKRIANAWKYHWRMGTLSKEQIQ